MRRPCRRRRKNGVRGLTPTISWAAGRSARSLRVVTERFPTACSSAAVSCLDVRVSSPIPRARIAFAFQRACPAGELYAMIGLPRTSASRQVTPAVEWTTASEAAISSFISSVKPRIRARGSSAKSDSRRLRISSLSPQIQTTFEPSSFRAAPTARSSFPTPQPPPETRISGPVLRQSQGAARIALPHPLEKPLLHEGADDARASAAGDPLDRTDTGLVHDQVQIDPGVGPEWVDAEVADGGERGHLQDALAAIVADDARRRGMRRDDDVRVDAPDQAQQRFRTERDQAASRDRPAGREAGEEEAFDAVRPCQRAELDAVDVAAHEGDHPADVLERVVDDHLRTFALELRLERTRDSAVPLALLGREDKHAPPGLRRGVRLGSQLESLAHRADLPANGGRRQPF